MIKQFKKIYRPNSLKEARDFSSQDNTLYYAGGTDLMPHFKDGIRWAEQLVMLQDIEELKCIKFDDIDTLHIGAMVTLDQLDNDPLVNALYPELSYAAARVASPQIRNLATVAGNLMQDRRCIYFNQSKNWRESIEPCFKLGGNICHQAPVSKHCRASYYSDLATVLVCLEANVHVFYAGKRSKMKLIDLLKEHGEKNGHSEFEKILLESISIPSRHGYGFFTKQSTRDAIDFPIFNAASSLSGLDDSGQLTSSSKVHLVVGAINNSPQVLEKTEIEFLKVLKKDFDHLPNDLLDLAISEIKKKAVPVLEDDITPKIKRDYYKSIEVVMSALMKNFILEL